MAEPTLAQVFGANAVQTANTLTISKADLTAAIGLTASADNTAESLLAAVIEAASKYLTDTNQQANPDQSIAFFSGSDSLITRGANTYRRKTRTIDFDKVDSGASFSPNDY